MILVCDECLDVPQQQLRTITIPPDPIPVEYPRAESYGIEVPSFLVTLDGNTILTLADEPLIVEYQDTPTPDPNSPVLYP